jgi:hypothetical protein
LPVVSASPKLTNVWWLQKQFFKAREVFGDTRKLHDPGTQDCVFVDLTRKFLPPCLRELLAQQRLTTVCLHVFGEQVFIAVDEAHLVVSEGCEQPFAAEPPRATVKKSPQVSPLRFRRLRAALTWHHLPFAPVRTDRVW